MDKRAEGMLKTLAATGRAPACFGRSHAIATANLGLWKLGLGDVACGGTKSKHQYAYSKYIR